MLTDAEVDSLAREILTEVIAEINDWNGPPFEDIEETEDGEPIPIFGATSEEGYGSFRCEYMPLAAVKKIVVECERIFDNFTVRVSGIPSGKSVEQRISEGHLPESRSTSIRSMAACSVMHLLASFRERMCDVLEENVKDCEVIAESLLASVVGEQVKRAVAGKVTADVRSDIEKAAERVAERKRTMLRVAINGLPHVLAERGRGAPAKSPEEKEREAKTYAAKVEGAYRKLRLETGGKPKKIKVAKELGAGGLNRDTGIDSSLQAFNNKLKRLGITYDLIAKKVEDELNTNSE